MDAEDLAQVTDSLRRAVQGADATDDIRRSVAEFGWHELLKDEAEAAVATMFALQGELLLPASFLDDVLVAASGLTPLDDVRVLLPRAGSLEPTSTLEGSVVHLAGVLRSGEGGPLLVPCLRDGKLVLAMCVAPGPLEAAGTIDESAGWVGLEADVEVGELLAEGEDAASTWERMSATGQRALAQELVAVGGEMLRLTVEHVTAREQFGQALGAFQAVKHKLADVRLWQEVATLSAEAAWEDCGAESAALAKAAACRFTRTARENCQQLLGGMGFTWEHPFHTYLRRALVLEPLLGGASAQHKWLGEALRERGVSRELAGL